MGCHDIFPSIIRKLKKVQVRQGTLYHLHNIERRVSVHGQLYILVFACTTMPLTFWQKLAQPLSLYLLKFGGIFRSDLVFPPLSYSHQSRRLAESFLVRDFQAV